MTEQYTNTVLCRAHNLKTKGWLEIERGRYAGIPADQKVCKLCSDGVEDEIHFSVKCIALDSENISLFSHIRRLCPCNFR